MDDFRISPLLYGQFAVVEGTMYISACNYNGFYAVDINSGKLEFLGKFLRQGNFDIQLFNIKEYGRKLIFVPEYAREAAMYDRDLKQIEEIPMKDLLNTEPSTISTAAIIEHKLYMFPAKARSIIVYDLQSKEITDVLSLADKYTEFFKQDYITLGASDANYVYENKIYVVCWQHSALMSLDINNKSITFYPIAECEEGFCALCGRGESIYALNRNGKLIKWDAVSQKTLETAFVIPEGEDAESYRKLFIMDDYIYAVPYTSILRVIKIDINTMQMTECLTEKFSMLCKESAEETIYFGCVCGTKLYCYTDRNQYLCIDLKREEMEWKRNVDFDSDKLRKIILDEEGMSEKGGIISETVAVTVKELMHMACNRIEMGENTGNEIGRKIHKEIG